jgi:heme A synthase
MVDIGFGRPETIGGSRHMQHDTSISAGGSPPPSPAFTRFAWIVAGYTLLAIIWGYVLRISKSGDGCGTDWPLCHGAAIPAAPTFPTLVEYTHRLSSGLVLILVAVLAVWAFRAWPRRHPVRFAAGMALCFTITESLFGALLVVFGLVADDASLARVIVRPFHVTNTLLLVAAVVLIPWWATRTPPTRLVVTRDLRVLLAGAAAVAVLAWTGSWTGLANSAFPAASLHHGLTQYLDPEHFLIYLRLAHPVLAIPAVVLLTWCGLRLRARLDGSDAALALGIAATAVVQLILGPVAIVLREALWPRLLHLVVVDATWILIVLLGSTLMAAASAPEASRAPLDLPVDPAAQPQAVNA